MIVAIAVLFRSISAMVLIPVMLCLVGGFFASAFAVEYKLGPQDKVRIKIVEWRPGNGQAVDWAALSDSYTISAGGKISMPILGEFQTTGKTTSQLASQVGTEMQKRVGMPSAPEVSIEVESYKPIYIIGYVEKPGEYAFRPDLTPIQAVGVAGGLYRPTDIALMRLDKERVSIDSQIETSKQKLIRSAVRVSRLESALNWMEAFAIPEVWTQKEGGTILSDEKSIAKAQFETLNAQIEASRRLQALLDEQIKAIELKLISQDKQIELSNKELQTYSNLTSQGLGVNTRLFALERSLAEMEGRKIDYQMALLTARLDRRRAEQSQTDVRNEWRSKRLDDLSKARSEEDQANLELKTQGKLAEESKLFVATQGQATGGSASGPNVSFSITRRDLSTGSTATFMSGENGEVQPGDVIRVLFSNRAIEIVAREQDNAASK